MWPNSPFAIPTSSFNSPVPLVDTDPDTGPFITVCFNKEWQPYIVGALKQLMLQTTWDTHDPNQLNLVQQRANNLINLFFRSHPLCNPETSEIARSGAEGDENLIRQDPDNPCLLQTSINGTDWCTFADLSLCLGAPAQPTTNQPQPQPGGGCQSYAGAMAANNRWIAPTLVNAGDTVHLLNPFGAGQDGTEGGGLEWRCFDGFVFFQDFCVTTTQRLESTDPLNTAPHMALIANIAGVFYDLTAGPITVPGGVSNAQVIVQVNDAVLTDNAGNYTFNLEVCNNAATGWSQDFNFLINTGGWAPFNSGQSAHWVSGSGWENNAPGSTPEDCAVDFVMLHSATLTHLSATCNVTAVHQSYQNAQFEKNTVAFQSDATLAETPGGTLAYVGSQSFIAGDVLRIGWNISASPLGSAVLVSAHAEGTGTNPFI